MTSDQEVIQIEALNFRYTNTDVLENINLEIKRGDYVGLIGPNGSGKSTLVKIILGLLTPQSGSVKLFGREINAFSDWQKIGYVPQRAGSEIMQFPVTTSEVIGMEGVNAKTVTWALEQVEMVEYKDKLIAHLSGGQQQRVFIARALAKKPELLVLDEPTTGIDQEAQTSFYELLKKLNKEHKITLIVVSHDIDVVAHEVTHLICVNKTIVCHGKPKDVLNSDFLKRVYGDNLRMVVHDH